MNLYEKIWHEKEGVETGVQYEFDERENPEKTPKYLDNPSKDTNLALLTFKLGINQLRC